MEQREKSEYFEKMAEALIDTTPELAYIKNSQVKIVYLVSSQAKKAGAKVVHGECEKIPAKYRWAIPADFSITLFAPNNEHMSERQLEILLFHELLHIGIEPADDGGENYNVIPHDLEDFKTIIDKYGTDWSVKEK
jgi:predicted metallopeptidase